MPGSSLDGVTEEASFDFVAPLWLYPGDAGWFFVSLPTEVADDIADLTAGERRGFGSVKVEVRVGDTAWSTSVFPDTRTGTYLLPVKKAVRVAEGLDEGSDVAVRLRLVHA